MALVCPLLPTALLQVSHTVPCLLSQSVSSRHGASSPHVRSVSFSAALTKEQKTVVFFIVNTVLCWYFQCWRIPAMLPQTAVFKSNLMHS